MKKNNSSFLDSVVNITEGEESDYKKISKITGLAKGQNSPFESILGKDTVKKYCKKNKKANGSIETEIQTG